MKYVFANISIRDQREKVDYIEFGITVYVFAFIRRVA